MNQSNLGGQPEKQNPGEPPRPLDYQRPKHHWVIWLVVICIGSAVAFLVVHAIWEDQSAANQKAALNNRPLPVVATNSYIGDMPLYLDELGTVTPLNTVTVHTRVDGQLIKVAFVEGQFVHQGDLLAEIDPAPFRAQLEQSQGQLIRDQALLVNAKLDLKRYQDAPDTVTQQQLDTQKALVSQDEGTVKSDQGQVDNAKVQLDYCTVTSPISGRVGLRQVDQGNIVHAADTNGLAVITQLQPITVVFSVVQDDIPKVVGESGTARPLHVDAYDRSGANLLSTGSVAAVDSEIDPTTAMVKLKATFTNEDNALFPSQFVNMRMLVRTLHNVVLVPTDAVQRGPDNNSFIYVVKLTPKSATQTSPTDNPPPASTPPASQPDSTGGGKHGGQGEAQLGTVEVRSVTTDPDVDRQGAEQSVIVSGLDPGEIIVVKGLDRLQADAKVSVRMQAPTTRPQGSGASTRNAATRGTRGHGKHGHKNAASQPSETEEQSQ